MNWRVGIELEWLAPKGLSRQAYAQYLASQHHAKVQHFWHPQVEPSKVPGKPLFHNLTPGFSVQDKKGTTIAHTVGDLTIQKQLHRQQPPAPGWYRILSDDIRLIHLMSRHAKTIGSPFDIMQPVADLFGTTPKDYDGIVRVEDIQGSSIALCAPMPGERERVCEVVSGIFEAPYIDTINQLIEPAKTLDFSIPIESATHIHFCAAQLQNPRTLRNLIHLLHTYRFVLRDILHTNTNCVRLGAWPADLFACIAAPDFATLSWKMAQQRLKELPMSKFCDFNIKNLIFGFAHKNTFELRILPGLMNPNPICDAIRLFTNIFTYCQQEDVLYHEPLQVNMTNRDDFLVRIHHHE